MKKLGLLILLMCVPLNIFAYSSEVIVGGNTVGIEVKSDGVMVVGFYKVNGKYNKGTPELLLGDYITSINGEKIESISDLTAIIEKNAEDKEVDVTFKRGNKSMKTVLELVLENDTYKTGLYVKDSITGIGTLTYIDPETGIYGALGHEIIEASTNEIVEVGEGTIFRNAITSIDKSSAGTPGSKNAKFYYQTKFGSILENTKYGIYGIYEEEYPDNELMTVGNPSDIKIGPAVIYTVLENETIEEYSINITKINEDNDIKNITFEITDERLINATGGVVQGMSGSPIVQGGDTIIGSVTHVIVDAPITGYGLFITTMLEEGEN